MSNLSRLLALATGPRRMTGLSVLLLSSASVMAGPALPLARYLPDLTLTRELTLERSVQPVTSGHLSVIARPGDTARQIAHSYRLPLSALAPQTSPDRPLPTGAVLDLTLEPAEGRRPTSVDAYVAQPGDTLAGLAARHRLSVTALLSANLTLTSLDRLTVGQTVYIPREPGLLLPIKPGQTVEQLVQAYHADPARVAVANGISLPNELKVGDYLLLPGVLATGFHEQLLARRAEAAEQARLARIQAQYDRYQAQLRQQKRERLQRQYALQQQYDRYQAYLHSPARQALVRRYEQQAQYEAAQRQARQQALAQRPSSSSTVRAASAAGGPGLAWPLRSYRITSRYGEADIEFHKEYFHGGVDLAAPYGTPIYAATAGTVTRSGYGDYGLNVYTDSSPALVIYGHMSRTAVAVGQQVERGQLLGYVGCTGICTGPHLHFEVRLSGQAVDPLALLP
ncbi:LysM peptidoglycan-binding domain-containing M23 family metallopeptidase [Deinococcus sonorensis]|uniref:LysM peptidoglycan-binding domain-containing M23 family metallopeptidase n=2 Tax=Deinococcus sonorensis TaxID=309891 RepID=A0AAU7U8I0_9DEIO